MSNNIIIKGYLVMSMVINHLAIKPRNINLGREQNMETKNQENIANMKLKNMLGRGSKVGQSVMGNKIFLLLS